MSPLKELQNASNLKELAPLIGYKPSSLAFILYKMPADKKYTSFEIPKKSGGTRVIDAPISRLKALQRHLADFLVECRREIEESGVERNTVSHGFRSGYSIVTNARQHRNRKYVLNLDIGNFFPSLNFGRVRGFFIKNDHFKLNDKVATIIAQIACYNNGLPQGSPCSPIISDLIARVLDIRLTQLAKRHKCTYSRYVDDLTFSTGKKKFPVAIAYPVEGEGSFWAAGGSLLRDINRLGFSINHVKTRMQYRTSRQMVTGLTVNKRVNIRSDYYRSARAMCHSLFTIGTFTKPIPKYAKEEKKTKDGEHSELMAKPPTINQLAGVLSYIQSIKDQEKARTLSDQEKIAVNKKIPLQGMHKLHKRFLFFRHFISPDKPLIICEGKTDSIYLKTAIRRLPGLAEKFSVGEGANKESSIRFFNYNNHSHKILQLTGGSDPLRDLTVTYEACVSYYKYAPLPHPVILLIDNDSGADGIFKYLGGKHVGISLTSDAAFYLIAKNLYLVKTIESGEKGTSCIEDCFAKEVLKELVNGKMFNPKKEHGSPTEYGKAIFAEKVIVPNSKIIDFAKFEPLLQRIQSVIADYTPPVVT